MNGQDENGAQVISADDPRRLLHEGDIEKAYPQHAKEKLRHEQIDTAIQFLQWFVTRKDIAICQLDEQGEIARVVTRDPYARVLQRYAFEWQEVDFDAFFREKDVMFNLLAQAQKQVLAKKVAEAQAHE